MTERSVARPRAGSSGGPVVVAAIMFLGSLGLWVGTPLLWLWIGGQVQGATSSLGTALAVAFLGVVVTATGLALLLARLSELHRGYCIAKGSSDPGSVMLEAVLVVSAGLTIAAFLIWFFFLAGTSPVPIGIQI
ncbi:MAG: hypothetical protein ACYC0H_21185 [Solirubrobacteraceae bacterium]